ncbi:MAG: hypothetical protein KatS3mg114_0675 [Planctomycetaceae bacterium]|nr:MAG: hypothetical protein KatS3mg114_0675 [Planctomycetaceae bacterium]
MGVRRSTAVIVLSLVVAACRAPYGSGLPSRHAVRADQLLILSDVRLPKGHPLLADLEHLRSDIARVLELPLHEQQITVYLFADEERYASYLQRAYPHLPPRRAYFVGTPRELAVYTYWGDKIQEDLRHEYTHGVLHASLKDVPLWLDEGLAEYFEDSRPPLGYNRDYLHRLQPALAEGWQPQLERLEQIQTVGQMQPQDYFEAWAWVHFFLHESEASRQVLLEYVHALRQDPHPTPLSQRLREHLPSAQERCMAYLSSLGRSTLLGEPATRSAGYRP